MGIAPWMTALAADAVLVVLTEHVPWRELPVLTAAGAANLAGKIVMDATNPIAAEPPVNGVLNGNPFNRVSATYSF